LNTGALFSAGDAHAAQGDGEVSINGIECPASATLRSGASLSRDEIEKQIEENESLRFGSATFWNTFL
jgi:acetamidase/formamidase